MPEERETGAALQFASLGRGITRDVGKLLGEHIERLRAEVKDALSHLERGALALGAGTGLTLLGGALSTLALVHLLNRVTRLPLWACYGLAAGGLVGAGASLLQTGIREVAEIKRLAAPSPQEENGAASDQLQEAGA